MMGEGSTIMALSASTHQRMWKRETLLDSDEVRHLKDEDMIYLSRNVELCLAHATYFHWISRKLNTAKEGLIFRNPAITSYSNT